MTKSLDQPAFRTGYYSYDAAGNITARPSRKNKKKLAKTYGYIMSTLSPARRDKYMVYHKIHNLQKDPYRLAEFLEKKRQRPSDSELATITARLFTANYTTTANAAERIDNATSTAR